MTLQITDMQETTKKVAALVDPDIEFISLVKNPATRNVFTVRRSAGDSDMKSLHKIITRSGVALATIAAENPSAVWLKDVATTSEPAGENHVCYRHMDESEFEPNSFDMVPVGNGAWAVVGVLRAEADKTKSISVAESSVIQRAGTVPQSPLAALNGYGGGQSAMEMLGNQFYTEWYALQDIIWGGLTQSSLTMKQRKTIIGSAITGFGNFTAMMLDAMDTGDESTQRSAEMTAALKPVLDALQKALIPGDKETTINRATQPIQPTNTGDLDMSMTPDDVKKIIRSEVGSAVAETIKEMRAADAKAAEEAAAKRAAEEKDALIAENAKQIAALRAEIDAIKAGTDASPATPTGGDTSEESQQQRSAEIKDGEGATKVPATALDGFAGLFEGMLPYAPKQ